MNVDIVPDDRDPMGWPWWDAVLVALPMVAGVSIGYFLGVVRWSMAALAVQAAVVVAFAAMLRVRNIEAAVRTWRFECGCGVSCVVRSSDPLVLLGMSERVRSAHADCPR